MWYQKSEGKQKTGINAVMQGLTSNYIQLVKKCKMRRLGQTRNMSSNRELIEM